jgi:hypothetical protein
MTYKGCHQRFFNRLLRYVPPFSITTGFVFNRFALFLGQPLKLLSKQRLASELTPKRNFAEGEFQIVGKKTLKVFFHQPPQN